MTRKSAPTAAAVLLLAAGWAQQQSTAPQLGYAYPAGARQGQTVEIVLGGQRLGGQARVWAGPGIRAEVLDYTRPMTPKELQETRDKLQEAAKKLGLGGGLRPGQRGNPAQLARIAQEAGVSEKDIQRYFAFLRERADPKRQPNPQLAETLRVRVAVAPEAAPGLHELRVVSPLGLSNPVRFYVGTVPEFNEVEPNDAEPCPVPLIPPFVLNGQILPGEEDRFAFNLRKGQTVLIAAMARAVIPYLADAVPGWFQARLTLIDPDGREAAAADHDGANQDPCLRFTPAKDGRYTLAVRDAIYRGREDFVYRIAVGPPTAAPKPGPAKGAIEEKEPNGTPAQAQSLALPAAVEGRIDRPGDVDVYRFRGKAGDTLVAETTARRDGSPLDSTIEVAGPNGRRLAFNDDFADKGAGLVTHQADSHVHLTLPADGEYRVAVRDAQGRGGPDFFYRLRVGPPQPDFELRVVPSGVTLRPGFCTPVTVHALRKDGFDGEIRLSLAGAPKGVELAGGLIPAGADKVRVTLASGFASSEPFEMALVGTAEIGGKTVARRAVPAEDMMQAFAYRHLVPASAWLGVTVGRFARAAAGFRAPEEPVRIPLGGSATVRLKGPGRLAAEGLTFELSDPPEGLTLGEVRGAEGSLIVKIQADPAKLKPGAKGNLILDAFLERPGAAPNRQASRKTLAGSLPAIPYEIVKP